ncbi:IclR family transcriptional regulator [Scopulibacillus cellulosilyticus]|uniref:IclR family transcriptional regulator n=1 Tax=Scopulibacillus cellulosilyticus TaxID=2665665 RepID=A0ABW2PU62_9BACL
MTNEVGTLKKGLDIFRLLLERPGITVQEIMETLGFNKSTTYRLVNTLEQNNFIIRNDQNRYQVSSELVLTVLQQNQAPFHFDWNWGAVPAMQELCEKTNETIYIGIIHGLQVVTTQVVSGHYSTRTHSEIGNKSDIHTSAIGKCILAYQTEDVQKRIVKALDYKKYTENTITDRFRFEKELHHIREMSYAIDDEEGEPGNRCIAAPIWKNGKVVAAIALSGPSVRVSKQKDDTYGQLVKQCAGKISSAIARNDS